MVNYMGRVVRVNEPVSSQVVIALRFAPVSVRHDGTSYVCRHEIEGKRRRHKSAVRFCSFLTLGGLICLWRREATRRLK